MSFTKEYLYTKSYFLLSGDMVEAWLKMKDDVYDEHGEPTWNSLVKGLKKVNQKSIASKIIGNEISQ